MAKYRRYFLNIIIKTKPVLCLTQDYVPKYSLAIDTNRGKRCAKKEKYQHEHKYKKTKFFCFTHEMKSIGKRGKGFDFECGTLIV